MKLEGAAVTDDAVKMLTEMTKLKRLSLYDPSVTNEGLKPLLQLGRLEAIGIGKTGVTDEDIKLLEGFSSLRWLWIFECENITNEAIAELKTQLPELKVYR